MSDEPRVPASSGQPQQWTWLGSRLAVVPLSATPERGSAACPPHSTTTPDKSRESCRDPLRHIGSRASGHPPAPSAPSSAPTRHRIGGLPLRLHQNGDSSDPPSASSEDTPFLLPSTATFEHQPPPSTLVVFSRLLHLRLARTAAPVLHAPMPRQGEWLAVVPPPLLSAPERGRGNCAPSPNPYARRARQS